MSLPPGRVIEDDPPAKPAGNHVSPFAGRGALLDDWASAGRVRGLCHWVAVHADGWTEAGEPRADPEIIQQIRQAGFEAHAWYSFDREPAFSFAQLDCHGLICQAEGPGQLQSGLTLAATLDPDRPKALVTNDFMDKIPSGWDVLAEEYWNVSLEPLEELVGSATQGALNRGAQRAYPCFGVGGPWGEALRVVPLADYCKFWGPTDFSVYLAETLTDADIEFLHAKAGSSLCSRNPHERPARTRHPKGPTR